MVEVDVSSSIRTPLAVKPWQKLCDWVFSEMKVKSFTLSLVFCGDKRMKRLNTQYRGKHKTTDVLSFLYEPQEGEVVISVPQAKRQAKQSKHSVEAEIRFLIIHGILHLLGYDHEIEKEKVVMFALQDKLEKRYGDINI